MFVSRVGAGDTSIWDTASFSRTNIPTVMNPCGGEGASGALVNKMTNKGAIAEPVCAFVSAAI